MSVVVITGILQDVFLMKKLLILKKNSMLKLVTISRISKEKGFDRMLQLEALLLASDIRFSWDCYGDTRNNYAKAIIPKFRQVKFRGVTQDPLTTVKQYHYLVQLSSTEGFCYSIYEALSKRVPVLVTNYDSVGEMITDGENGYILDMDLSNFDPKKIIRIPVIKSFTEKSNEQDWINFLKMTKATTKTPPASGSSSRAKFRVKVTRKYHDLKMNKTLEPGFEFKASATRAEELVNAKVAVRL